MHIYGIWKEGTDEIICRAAMRTQTQRRDLCSQCDAGEERVGYVERVTWKHTLPYVKQIDKRDLKSGLCNNLEGWDGKGRLEGVQGGPGIC